MPRINVKSLQVTEIRSMEYLEFHNCFGAVPKGRNCDIGNYGFNVA